MNFTCNVYQIQVPLGHLHKYITKTKTQRTSGSGRGRLRIGRVARRRQGLGGMPPPSRLRTGRVARGPVNEDLASETIEERKEQFDELNAAKKAGKTTYLVLDRLVIKERRSVEPS